LFSPLLFMVPPSVHTRIHTQTHTQTQSHTQSHVYTHAQKFSMSEPWTQVCAHLKESMSYSIISVFLFWYSVLSIGTVKMHNAFVVKVSLSAHMLMRTSCTMHITLKRPELNDFRGDVRLLERLWVPKNEFLCGKPLPTTGLDLQIPKGDQYTKFANFHTRTHTHAHKHEHTHTLTHCTHARPQNHAHKHA